MADQKNKGASTSWVRWPVNVLLDAYPQLGPQDVASGRSERQLKRDVEFIFDSLQSEDADLLRQCYQTGHTPRQTAASMGIPRRILLCRREKALLQLHIPDRALFCTHNRKEREQSYSEYATFHYARPREDVLSAPWTHLASMAVSNLYLPPHTYRLLLRQNIQSIGKLVHELGEQDIASWTERLQGAWKTYDAFFLQFRLKEFCIIEKSMCATDESC